MIFIILVSFNSPTSPSYAFMVIATELPVKSNEEPKVSVRIPLVTPDVMPDAPP